MPPTTAGQTETCKCGHTLQIPGAPAKKPEPEVRCHQCGKMHPLSEIVRQAVPTASISTISTSPVGGQVPVFGTGSITSRVDMCKDCVALNERIEAANWAGVKYALVAF